MSYRKSFRKLFLFLLTLPVYFFIFFPLLWLFSASLSTQVELFTVPPHWIPDHPTFQNYLDIFFPSLAASSVPRTFATALLNSIKIASAVTIICIFIGSLAAYALVRIPFKFNRTIQLGIIRDGKPMQMGVKVGEYHKSGTEAAANDGGPKQGNTGRLGLAVDDLDQDARQQLQIPGDVKGAAVAQVRPGSPAEDAGLQPGDVVLEVNRKPVTSAEQFANIVRSTPAGKDILLLVWSKGNNSYRVVHPSSASNRGM